MAKPSNLNGITDYVAKRDLIKRYRACWDHELAMSSLTESQRAAIARDRMLLGSIDEDLVRLHHHVLITGSDANSSKQSNDEIRQEILSYLVAADGPVTINALCDVFDTTTDRIRNLMRPFRASGAVVLDGNGYRALTPVPAGGSGTERGVSQ